MKMYVKKNSMSLGLVGLYKLFTWTHMPMPQSDDIMSADLQVPSHLHFLQI